MTIVYSKPSCVQCNATYRALDAKGIEYQVVDLTDHPEKVAEFQTAGFMQAPVVVSGGGTWSGFQPDKIASLA